MSLSIGKEINISIGGRLKEERERLGFNQTDFAALVGKDKKTQIRWEKGGNTPSAAEIMMWASKGLDAGYLLGGDRNIPDGSKLSPIDALRLIADVLDDLDIQDMTGDQMKSLLLWAHRLNPSKELLTEFIKSAYTVAGKNLPKLPKGKGEKK